MSKVAGLLFMVVVALSGSSADAGLFGRARSGICGGARKNVRPCPTTQAISEQTACTKTVDKQVISPTIVDQVKDLQNRVYDLEKKVP